MSNIDVPDSAVDEIEPDVALRMLKWGVSEEPARGMLEIERSAAQRQAQRRRTVDPNASSSWLHRDLRA